MRNKLKIETPLSFQLELSADEAADWHSYKISEESAWDWVAQLAAKIGLPVPRSSQRVGEVR